MAGDWDIFADEQKDGSKVTSLGMLVLHRGVVCQAARAFVHEKSKLHGSTRAKIGSIHWSALGAIEAQLANEWLERYFQGPLMFYVFVPCDPPRARLEVVRDAITSLEQDGRIPAGGLHRSKTTIHMDYDDQDAGQLDIELVRAFGLLRAFHWDDRGSPLIQFTDLMLAICNRDYHQLTPTPSAAETIRSGVYAHAKARYAYYASRDKKNWVFAQEPQGKIRELLT